MTVGGETTEFDFGEDLDDDPNDGLILTSRAVRNGVHVAYGEDFRDPEILLGTWFAWGRWNIATPYTGAWLGEGVPAPGLVLAAMPVSMGRASGSNPVSGSAAWRGAMVGVTVDPVSPQDVIGDASLRADLGAARLDLTFGNIRETGTGRSHRDRGWTNLAMQDGAFSHVSGRSGLSGRFYGPGHEEAGGIFEHAGSAGETGPAIAGAFSLTRQ